MAVADAARRRTAGLDAGQVLAAAIGERGPGRRPRHRGVIDARLRYRSASCSRVRPGPWSARVPPSPTRTPRLPHRDRRADGRPQGPPRRARRRPRPALGGHRPRPRPRPPAGPAGLAAPALASIGAWRELSGYDHPTDPIGPNRSQPPPTCEPPGTRPSPPSARPTARTCAACPTGCCGTCATPTDRDGLGARVGRR